MEEAFPNIVCTSEVLNGSPRIDGRRLAVSDVISFLNNYGTLVEVINDYELTTSEIKQALLYCSILKCKQDNPNVFCHNCSLRREQEGALDTSDLEEMTSDGLTFVKGDKLIFFGSMEELMEDWNGYDWWTIATHLLIDLRNEI